MFSTSHKNGMGSNAYTNTPSSMVGEQYASVGGGAPWRHIFRGVVDPTNVTMRCCKVSDVSTPLKWTSGYRRGSTQGMLKFA
jgi:hypothetical protein